MDAQTPEVLAMVLADTILIDEVSGKKTIQGTYSLIHEYRLQLFGAGQPLKERRLQVGE